MNDIHKLDPSTPTNVGSEFDQHGVHLRKKERLITIAVLCGIALFTIADLLEDRIEGASWAHVFAEFIVVLVAVLLIGYLVRQRVEPWKERAAGLEIELGEAQAAATRWRSEARELLQGLSAAINRQFDDWGLSKSERDIAMLLLKGFSHKEIAALRERSERTVRQQGAAVYQKSGLNGRAELSAFFLEDLLAESSGTDTGGMKLSDEELDPS